MMTTRPMVFAVIFRTMPGVDGIRALRALLKLALRRFGLRCLDAREISNGVARDLQTTDEESAP